MRARSLKSLAISAAIALAGLAVLFASPATAEEAGACVTTGTVLCWCQQTCYSFGTCDPIVCFRAYIIV
jgi:hypothetical protein